MLGSTTSFRQWLAEVQPFVIRQFDRLLSYLREIDTPSRRMVFLVALVSCQIVLEGSRPESA